MKQTIYRLYALILGIIFLSFLACDRLNVVTPTPGPDKVKFSNKTEPPSASFIVNVDSGSAPLTVEFHNNSLGPATAIEWDFGDGTTSTTLSPVHRYTVAGTYDVKLSVSGPGGSDTIVMTQLITVEPRLPVRGGGEWITKSPIPTPRGGLVAESLSDGIHVVSGSDWDATYPTIVHEVYDPVTDTWTTKASPHDLHMGASTSAVVNGKIFLIGGYAACECAPPTMIRMYDPALDTWEYKAAIPEQGFNWGHATAVVNDEIYVIGGKSGKDEVPDHKVLRYDPTNDSWTGGLAPIPINFESLAAETFDGLAAVTIAGKIYVVVTGEHLQIYDPVSDNWTQGAILPVPTKSPSVVVLGGELYVFGGTTDWTKGGDISSVQIYDPETDQWRLSIDDLLAPRYLSAAAIHDGSVYVFGGYGPGRRILDYNEKLLLPRP